MRTVVSRLTSILLLAVTAAGCLTSPEGPVGGELIVESFDVGIDVTGELRGAVTVALYNSGTSELEWWPAAPNVERLLDGTWVTVWAPSSLPGDVTRIPAGGRSSRTFELTRRGVSTPGQWTEPYAGSYRLLVYSSSGGIRSEPFSFDPG